MRFDLLVIPTFVAFRCAPPPPQIVMFIGFLEYVISQIKLKPGYIPGDYVGSNDLFDGGEGDSTWRNFQVGMAIR